MFTSTRVFTAEFIGTALLLATVVGSGIMGDRLSGGNAAIALLANSLATGGGLLALILTFGPISGAHFNPVVTMAHATMGLLPGSRVLVYLTAQLTGACVGVLLAHGMFEEPLFMLSQRARSGGPQFLSEMIATFGLLAVIGVGARTRPENVPYAVAAYITSAYWFTASTSFANPAVTLARALTNTFTGIRPADVVPFVVAQCAGAAVATGLLRWLLKR